MILITNYDVPQGYLYQLYYKNKIFVNGVLQGYEYLPIV